MLVENFIIGQFEMENLIEEELSLHQTNDLDLLFDDIKSYRVDRTEVQAIENLQSTGKNAVSRTKVENPRKRKKNKQNAGPNYNAVPPKRPTIPFKDELNKYELYFFPKASDREIIQSIPISVHQPGSKQYVVQKMLQEARMARKKADRRNAIPKIFDNHEDTPEATLCRAYLFDKCTRADCEQMHHMRLPRRTRVCKFYIKNQCDRIASCLYLHNEFPCKFYYLDLPHPKSDEMCRFSHAGPLCDDMRESFLRQMENSMKAKLTDQKNVKNVDELILNEMNGIVDRLNRRQQQLINADRQGRTDEHHTNISKALSDSKDDLEDILTQTQISALKEDGCINLAKIRKLSSNQWKKYGISIDQMLKIQCKAIKEGGLHGGETVSENPEITRNDGAGVVPGIEDDSFEIDLISKNNKQASSSQENSSASDSSLLLGFSSTEIREHVDLAEEHLKTADLLAADLGNFFVFQFCPSK